MATKKTEVYKCALCGNITEVVHESGGELACCGQAMNKLDENSVEAATEKHVPVVEKIDGGYKVTVGSVSHPMADEHWIEWIELLAGDAIQIAFLKPGQTPEAIFKTDATDVKARAYCNLHGLWKS